MRKAWDGRSKRLDPDKLSRFMRKHKMRDTTAHPLKIDYKTEHRAELEFEQTVAYHNLSERAARLRLAALGEAEILDNDLPELTESQLEILVSIKVCVAASTTNSPVSPVPDAAAAGLPKSGA